MTVVDDPRWRKSTYSASQGECVEVLVSGVVSLRDTKDRAGGELHVAGVAWEAFVRGLQPE
jgi:hypothetical protein